jgi:hypothetical protein
MKRAALLVGWVLITPPWFYQQVSKQVPGKGYTDGDAPVSRWKHESSHDTAAQRESAKQGGFSAAITQLDEHIKKLSQHLGSWAAAVESDDHWLAYYRGAIEAWSDARCVPSEHLYPPKSAKETE